MFLKKKYKKLTKSTCNDLKNSVLSLPTRDVKFFFRRNNYGLLVGR
jgi:hypothetical protein